MDERVKKAAELVYSLAETPYTDFAEIDSVTRELEKMGLSVDERDEADSLCSAWQAAQWYYENECQELFDRVVPTKAEEENDAAWRAIAEEKEKTDHHEYMVWWAEIRAGAHPIPF